MITYDDVPAGYPVLKEIEGKTWEERKKAYEKFFKRKLKTLKEMQEESDDEEWRPYVPCSACEEIEPYTEEPEPIEI